MIDPADFEKVCKYGQTLRIFAAGHVFENPAIRWLRLAGFELFTEKPHGDWFRGVIPEERWQ